jgi:hypothetical protein
MRKYNSLILSLVATIVSVAIAVMLVFLINTVLSIVYSRPVAYLDWNAFRQKISESRNERRDWRPMEQVLMGCRPLGCRPYINPAEVRRGDREIWPIATRPNSDLVYCNESGFWKHVNTDRYGFDGNPDSSWNRSDILLLGDSFGTGACVEERFSFAGLLRAQGFSVLNLSVGGHQPLDELAVLKEFYAPSRVFVWLYFEGNDFFEALNADFLKQYLSPNFSQKLKLRQGEILSIFDDLESESWVRIEERAQRSPVGAPVANKGPTWLSKTFSPTMSFLTSFKHSDPIPFDGGSLERVLVAGREFAQQRGTARFILFYLPAWERFAWRPRLHPEVVKWDALKRSVAEVARTAGYEFVDSTPRLESLGGVKNLFPYGARGHYNNLAYTAVGQAIIESLGPNLQ